MNHPNDLSYSKSHEWIKMDGDTAIIGISDFAQDALGDVVFVNLPAEGDDVTAAEAFGDVESVKAVSDLICPVTGRVVAINEELLDSPELLNSDPYGAWIIKVEGITDKGYITNSYHVHVTEPIDAFKKLEFEAQFQHLSPGGAISYVEVPDMQNNLDAVLEVMKFIYDHIIYAELNTKSDYCQVCGWDGEIEIVEQDGKLIWRCPQCGNTDQDKMNVARRTCGYIGTRGGRRRSRIGCCICKTARKTIRRRWGGF